MACFRYPLPALSASNIGPPASSEHATIPAFPAGFSHPLIAVLPQEAGPLCLTPTLNMKVRMFILAGFIHHLAQLLCNMKAVEGDFLNRTWIRAALMPVSERAKIAGEAICAAIIR